MTTTTEHHTKRAVWNAVSGNLAPSEQQRIVAEVERTGASFDAVLLGHLRRGMAGARYCPGCGERLP